MDCPESSGHSTLVNQGADLLAGEPAGPLGRPESLGVEDVGDLLVVAGLRRRVR